MIVINLEMFSKHEVLLYELCAYVVCSSLEPFTYQCTATRNVSQVFILFILLAETSNGFHDFMHGSDASWLLYMTSLPKPPEHRITFTVA